ncbi:hypothetical protein NliqN6_6701 [Naganishia liquefaciens]|uniref:Uncharacterized protein n=1 Tax=Naganishia liquefaciens TaxID=104408 RepID=A0A8H3U059_9TREE|nr:hypothetical protein NliqN6_6701 [Naganishia liquefaciens]
MKIADLLIHSSSTGDAQTEDRPNASSTRPAIPLNIILEIGAFCAGSFNFRSLLNLSLSCKAVHEVFKPTLRVPILVWDSSKRPGKRFFAACLARFAKEEQAQVVPRRWRHVRYLVVNDVSLFRRDMTDRYLDGLLICFPRLTAIICRGGKTELPYVVNWQITLCKTPSLAIISSLLENTRRLISDFHQMILPPSIQLAFSREFLLTTPGDCIPLPWRKPFGLSMIAQIRLPAHGMERLCQLLIRYSSLCYDPAGCLTLELDPTDDHEDSENLQIAKALRQFRAVCATHPRAVAIRLRLPRYVEIRTAQIDILEKFYRTQRLNQYVHEKTLLFLGDGKHIEYDPEKNMINVRGGGNTVQVARIRKGNTSRRKMPPPEKQERWVEPVVEESGGDSDVDDLL